MNKISIVINKKTRMVNLSKSIIGNDSENLEEFLSFSFEDEFVNGQARLEMTINGEDSWIPLLKEEETYYCPIKSAITKEGKIDMQLVITENEDEDGIPIFKSNVFYVWVNKSINAEIEQPEEYPEWIDIANTKLNQMDNFDIDASKTGNTATVTITKRDGTEQSVEITDGETGPQGETGPAGQDGKDGKNGADGKDAKINGVNTINIQAGENIDISQSGSTMTISSTSGGGATYTAGTGIEITQQNVINNTLPSKIITVNANPETMQLEKNADEINEYLNNGYIVMALGYQVFRKDYDASTHTIQLAIYFGAFGQVITVVGNQVTNVSEYYYASDYNYVHTDNNFSYYYKDKLDATAEIAQYNTGLVNGGQVYDAINWVVDISNLSVGSNITDSETIAKLKDPRTMVYYNDTYFRFAKIYGSGYVFTVMNSIEGGEYITLNWTGSLFNFYEHGNAYWEVPSNKVQNLNTPTTETYPSTLAVYNALQGIGGGDVSYIVIDDTILSRKGMLFFSTSNISLITGTGTSNYTYNFFPELCKYLTIMREKFGTSSTEYRDIKVLFGNNVLYTGTVKLTDDTYISNVTIYGGNIVNKNDNQYYQKFVWDSTNNTYTTTSRASGSRDYFLLATNNTISYTPSGDYNPATKKYVDDKPKSYTGYDATKTQVLKNINGTLTWVDET